MLYSGTDPASYITEYTLVYEDYFSGTGFAQGASEVENSTRRGVRCREFRAGNVAEGCAHQTTRMIGDEIMKKISSICSVCLGLGFRDQGLGFRV